MNKPHITCYMMTSVDGRIDCAMTEHLPGVDESYPLLSKLNFGAVVSGRATAELELAKDGKFSPVENIPTNAEVEIGFFKGIFTT